MLMIDLSVVVVGVIACDVYTFVSLTETTKTESMTTINSVRQHTACVAGVETGNGEQGDAGEKHCAWLVDGAIAKKTLVVVNVAELAGYGDSLGVCGTLLGVKVERVLCGREHAAVEKVCADHDSGAPLACLAVDD